MKLIASSILLSAAMILGYGDLACAASSDRNSDADEHRYDFLRADKGGVWRLDRRSGKVSYCYGRNEDNPFKKPTTVICTERFRE